MLPELELASESPRGAFADWLSYKNPILDSENAFARD